jgi:hypothetical protein
MDSVCGCHSAEKCWRSCCCHTNREKLVWAKRNGIIPPTFVVVAARKEIESKLHSHASCCTKKQGNCEEREEQEQQIEPQEEQQSEASGQWVLSSVRRCQGSAATTASSELITIAIEVDTFQPDVSPAEWLELFDHNALSLDLSPASPPPKLG